MNIKFYTSLFALGYKLTLGSDRAYFIEPDGTPSLNTMSIIDFNKLLHGGMLTKDSDGLYYFDENSTQPKVSKGTPAYAMNQEESALIVEQFYAHSRRKD